MFYFKYCSVLNSSLDGALHSLSGDCFLVFLLVKGLFSMLPIFETFMVLPYINSFVFYKVYISIEISPF